MKLDLFNALIKQIDFCREMLETSTREEDKMIFRKDLEKLQKMLDDLLMEN